MIASLPMYDRPANAAAHDVFWALIRDNLRDAGIDAPDLLDRETDCMVGWARPDLVLGQICNLPFRAEFRNKVTVIGTADYGIENCPLGHYNSVFVVRRDAAGADPSDYAKARFAANSLMSHSGYGSPQAWAQARGFLFGAPLVTGAHGKSLEAVATGAADIAAIDAQTWRMQQFDRAHVADVAVIGMTTSSPGMTFITRMGQDPAPYFAAISEAIATLPADAAETLGLRGIHHLPLSDYDLPLPPLPAGISA